VADPATQVINIDGGCVYKHIPEFGYLTALNLDTLELHGIPNRD
jgi:serine/threonine protein phosphatase 1